MKRMLQNLKKDIGKECTHNLTITSEDISLAVFLRK